MRFSIEPGCPKCPSDLQCPFGELYDDDGCPMCECINPGEKTLVLFLQGAIVVNVEKLLNGQQVMRKTTLVIDKVPIKY